MAKNSWGSVLSEAGYLDEREAEAVDNPGGRVERELASGTRDERARELASMLQEARKLPEDSGFRRVARERAQNAAALMASEMSRSELETVAVDTHALLGPNLHNDAESAVVDTLRNAEYEKRNSSNDASVFDGAGVPESLDPRIRTSPVPDSFTREKNTAKHERLNKARQLRNQNEAGTGVDLNKKNRADELEAQAREIENVEHGDIDGLRRAKGQLSRSERADFLRDAQTLAEENHKTTVGDAGGDGE